MYSTAHSAQLGQTDKTLGGNVDLFAVLGVD
jgi:hypothetical protein